MPSRLAYNMSVHMPYVESPRGGLPHGYSNGYPAGSGAPPQSARVSAPVVQGFTFRSRQERIDWKKIASIDLERIMREFDVNSLQESILGITFCDIEREIDTRMVDQNFVIVFKLAQLIIQYLLHSQEVMAHNTSVAEERVSLLHTDHEATKTELARLGEELLKVKQESHKRKKLLKNQQSLITATANNYHKCMYCQKAFLNLAYLQSHVQRKHPEFTPRPAPPEDNVAVKKMTEMNERMEREMEELKDRLKFSESQLVEQKNRTEEQVKMVLQHQQVHSQVDVKKQEEQHRKELDRWKKEQLHFQKVEMEKMQNMFMKELKEMHDKYTSSQTAMENIQSKLGKQSMLGKVVDEDELEEYKKRSKKQEKELHKLREQIQAEVSSVENKMDEDLKKQEEKWKEKQKAIRTHHREEVKELKGLLEHTKQLLTIERQGGDKKGAKYQKQMQDLLKMNKEYERQIRRKEERIKELKVKASKHYEVVEPRSSPPPRMTISDHKAMEPPSEEDEEDTDLDVGEEELDAVNGVQPLDQQTFEKNRERIVKGLKEELTGVLQRNLAKRGVPEGMRGLSAQSLENKVKILKQERQQLAKQHSKFYDLRERFKREVDRKAAEHRKSGKPAEKPLRTVTSATPPPPYHTVSTASKPKGKPHQQQHQQQQQHHQQNQQQKQQQKQQQQKQQQQKQLQKQHQQKQKHPLQPALKKLSPGQVRTAPPMAPRSPDFKERGKGRGVASSSRSPANVPRTAARVSFEDESDEESEEDEEEEEEESESFEEEEEEENHYQSPAVPPRPAAHSQPTSNGFHNGVSEGQGDDDSEWDSEEISELEEVHDKPPPSKPVTSVRQPQGQMVSSLTRSIELQLSGRRQGQRPTGGVDLGGSVNAKPPQPAPRTPSPSPTPRIPTIPDAGDDDDDSGSLSVSSLNDSFSGAAHQKTTSPTPAPRMGASKRSGNDTDLSSNTYNTSMWGSSKVKGSGTGKSSIVSVTDFDDDDDDFGIDDLYGNCPSGGVHLK